MLLFVLFVSVNVGNIIVSYATFYRSRETEYLLTKPVPHVNVFIVKFLDNFFYSSTVLFVIVVSVLLGYGSHFRMPWNFYLETIVVQFVPFMLIAGCIAVTALMVLMKLAHRIGVGYVVAILSLLYFGSLFVFFKSTNPLQLVDSVMMHYPHVDQYFAFLDPPFVRFLPNHWIAESLYWTMRGNDTLAQRYALFMLSMAGVCFAGMVLVARKLFYSSWISSLSLRHSTEEQSSMLQFLSLSRPPRMEPQASVILRKEFWQFIREPSQWIHFGVIMLLVVTFIISIAKLQFNATLPAYLTVSYLVLLMFDAFLIASIALRFVYPMISIEGESFWSMLTAPLKRSKIYTLKMLTALLPLCVVSVLLAIFSHWSLEGHPLLLISASVIMISISSALVSLNLTAGSYFGNFKEKSPIKVASSQSATLTFLISIVYLTILIAIIFLPLNLYFYHALKGGEYSSGSLWFAVGAFVAISAAIATFAIVMGIRTLKRDF
jgi:ABC-2 type transport system permease protein